MAASNGSPARGSRVRTYAELGAVLFKVAGEKACPEGCGTTDPGWVGCSAILYNDMRPDGTLN